MCKKCGSTDIEIVLIHGQYWYRCNKCGKTWKK